MIPKEEVCTECHQREIYKVGICYQCYQSEYMDDERPPDPRIIKRLILKTRQSTSGEIRIMKGKTILQRKWYHKIVARREIIFDWKLFYKKSWNKLTLVIIPDIDPANIRPQY